MSKSIVLTVTRNEADRYLESFLQYHLPYFDKMFVYDDQSTDHTPELVKSFNDDRLVYHRRGDNVPSFMQHEGVFRQNSMEMAAIKCGLEEGDWIWVIDSDEFLIAPDMELSKALDDVMTAAEHARRLGVHIHRPELWHCDTDDEGNLTNPQMRIDGFWGTIVCARFFRWMPGCKIRNMEKPMGCDGQPAYVYNIPRMRIDPDILTLVHLGYVDDEDKRIKYERYDTLLDHGHNNTHIQSILTKGELIPFMPPFPTIYRGSRKINV